MHRAWTVHTLFFRAFVARRAAALASSATPAAVFFSLSSETRAKERNLIAYFLACFASFAASSRSRFLFHFVTKAFIALSRSSFRLTFSSRFRIFSNSANSTARAFALAVRNLALTIAAFPAALLATCFACSSNRCRASRSLLPGHASLRVNLVLATASLALRCSSTANLTLFWCLCTLSKALTRAALDFCFPRFFIRCALAVSTQLRFSRKFFLLSALDCYAWFPIVDSHAFLWKKLYYFTKIHVVSVSLLNVKNESSELAATYHIFFTRTPKASRKRDASSLFRLLSQKL